MIKKDGEAPASKSVTMIPSWVPRLVAVVVPVAAASAVLLGIAESVLLWGAVTLLFIGIGGLLAYLIAAGQFPPRLSKDAVELPAEEVGDTGKSLELVQKTVVELAERVEQLESKGRERETEEEEATA